MGLFPKTGPHKTYIGILSRRSVGRGAWAAPGSCSRPYAPLVVPQRREIRTSVGRSALFQRFQVPGSTHKTYSRILSPRCTARIFIIHYCKGTHWDSVGRNLGRSVGPILAVSGPRPDRPTDGLLCILAITPPWSTTRLKRRHTVLGGGARRRFLCAVECGHQHAIAHCGLTCVHAIGNAQHAIRISLSEEATTLGTNHHSSRSEHYGRITYDRQSDADGRRQAPDKVPLSTVLTFVCVAHTPHQHHMPSSREEKDARSATTVVLIVWTLWLSSPITATPRVIRAIVYAMHSV